MSDKYSISTRTLLISSFLIVALFTPIFATVSYYAVQEATEQSEPKIQNTLELANTSERTVRSSIAIVNNFENIKEYQENSDQSAAQEEIQLLQENFNEFLNASNELKLILNESEGDFTEEIEKISESQDAMEVLIQQNLGYVEQGVTLGTVVIESSREQLNQVSEASTSASTQLVQAETSELEELMNYLENLSRTIMFAGLVTIGFGTGIGLLLSVMISRPVKKLESEADKIREENFDEIKLNEIDSHILEFQQLRDMMEDVVLALKAEFDRERSEMNKLSIKLIGELSSEIPRSVAESSFTSACDNLGISPIKLKPEDVDEVISQLEISTKGLGISDEVFEEMRRIGKKN